MTTVALVVGVNNNLGYLVLKRLIDKYKGKIYFTTDDDTVGFKVLDKLKRNDVDLHYIQMDVTYTKSIIKVRHHIQDQDERIDLIINNTEFVNNEKRIPYAELVRRTLSVNFYGYINFGKLIYPLLTNNSRVINISGPAGLLKTIENQAIRKRISDPTITEDELVALMQDYEEAVRRGIEKTEGWGIKVQDVSKVALNAVTFLQHREWVDKGVVINCVNPGMQNAAETKSRKVLEKGARAILYLCLEAPLTLKGNFVWSDFSIVEWSNDKFVEITTV